MKTDRQTGTNRVIGTIGTQCSCFLGIPDPNFMIGRVSKVSVEMFNILFNKIRVK